MPIKAKKPRPLSDIPLSGEEARIINIGLQYVLWVYKLWTERRILVAEPIYTQRHRVISIHLRNLDPCSAATIKEVHADTYQYWENGGRLRSWQTNAMEVCILAVRVTRKLVRRRRVRFQGCDFEKTTDRLLSKLDKYRQRQKRRVIRDCGLLVYKGEQAMWHRFLRLLRRHLLHFKRKFEFACDVYKRRKRNLDKLQAWTTAALKERNIPPPPPRELRRLLRMFLRNVRRGYSRNYFVQDLVKKKWLAEMVCTDFVVKRMNG